MGYLGPSPSDEALKIGDDVILSSHINDGVIVDADINASASIAMSKTALVGGTGLTLSTNTLNVDAAQSQITSVGTLTGLTVQGSNYTTASIQAGSTTHGAILNLGDSGDIDYGSITQFASGAGEGGRMRFIAGTTETMNLRGGRVGIGDSNPGSPLDVKSGEAANTANFNSTSGATNITLESSGSLIGQMEFVSSGTSRLVTRTSASLGFGSNNTTALTLDSSQNATFAGNVLIGNTSGGSIYFTPQAGNVGGISWGGTYGGAFTKLVNIDNHNFQDVAQISFNNSSWGTVMFELKFCDEGSRAGVWIASTQGYDGITALESITTHGELANSNFADNFQFAYVSQGNIKLQAKNWNSVGGMGLLVTIIAGNRSSNNDIGITWLR